MRRQSCHSLCIFATRKIPDQMICSSEGSCHGNWWLSDRKWWPQCRSGWYKVIGVRNVLQKSSYRSCFVLLSKANACISYCWLLTISWFPQTQSAPVKAESNNAIPSLGTSLNRRLFLHLELWRPPFPSRQSHSVSPPYSESKDRAAIADRHAITRAERALLITRKSGKERKRQSDISLWAEAVFTLSAHNNEARNLAIKSLRKLYS